MLLNARDVIYMNKPDFYQFAIDTFRIKTKTSLYTNKKCTICNSAAKNTTKHFREESSCVPVPRYGAWKTRHNAIAWITFCDGHQFGFDGKQWKLKSVARFFEILAKEIRKRRSKNGIFT